MSKFKVGDLVKRNLSSPVTKYMVDESNWFDLGIIIEEFGSDYDGRIHYYSVFWFKMKRAQNTSELHLLTLEEAKELQNGAQN